MATDSTGADIVVDEVPDPWPSVLASDRLESVILAEVTLEWMVVEISEDLESKVTMIGNVDLVIQPE